MTIGNKLRLLRVGSIAWLLAVVSFPVPGAAAPPRVAAARVELNLVTEPGFPVGGTHQWTRALTELGLDGLRIRRLHRGESFRVGVEKTGTAARPRYRVRGVLTARNTLRLPGGTFRLRETARLARYLETLGAEGAEGITAAKERFGLTLRQLAETTDALSVPWNIPTVQVAPAQIVRAAQGRTALRITVDADAQAVLDRARPLAEAIRGLTLGTTLAAVLRRDGLILQPHKPRGAPVELAVARAVAGRDGWPIGWPPKRPPHRLAPGLFQSLNVEIRGQTLAATLEVIKPRIQVPLLLDRWALVRHQIDISQVTVSFPARRTAMKQVLDRVLFEAGLKDELRVDEAGGPFLWVTTIRK